MKRMAAKLTIAAGALALALTAVAPASAQRGGPPGQPGRPSGSFDIAYLNGLAVDHAQAHLRVNGFTKARNIRPDGRQWDLWFNRDFRESCAGFTSFNGRVTEVRFFSDNECGVGDAPTTGRELRPNELQGLRVNDAQQRLRLSGYTKARNIDINGRQWDLWQNPRARTSCVGFTSYNSRITQADGFRDRDCSGQNSGPGGGPGWGSGGPGQGGPGWGGGRFDVRNLIRMGVREGQDELRYAGYSKARNINVNGRQWDLWYSDRARDRCVGFTSWNGQITDADTFRESNCR